VLTNEVSIAPQRWERVRAAAPGFPSDQAADDVSIETQNKMYTYKMDGGKINPEIVVPRGNARRAEEHQGASGAGTVHVQSDGGYLYGANRAQDTIDVDVRKFFKGAKNSIVVYSINQSTGEPVQIQNIETHAIHPRTFQHRSKRTHAGRAAPICRWT